MSGSGYQSFWEIWLRLRSQHKLREPSFFQMKRTGAPWEEQDGTDEPCSKVLINELIQSRKFLLGQGVNGAKSREVPSSSVILRS